MATQFPLHDFLSEVGTPENLASTLAVQQRLETDPAIAAWLEHLRAASLARRRYWDLTCALNLLARRRQPERYLEIGVRRGKSMAQVAAQNPHGEIYGFDLWITPYAGVDNPGPPYVRDQMTAVGHRGKLELVSGPSQQTLPRFLADHPDLQFDLVTVDGDHSDEGARADLLAAAARFAPGGYLLFDDLLNPHHTLLPVWQRFCQDFAGRFLFSQNLQDHHGLAGVY